MNTPAPDFPFSAVTGQDQFKLALILVAIDPSIGGVLISGPRGTAKSTLARGLPNISPCNQNFVTLPLGASEEMLIGTLDLQKVLDQQKVDFHPGLLARAHQGILYVDEVNLLPDNLVDSLLDVAASGVNRVERDGISHTHDARFILLGTMNPDEGELRPQLLDRFGLMVQVEQSHSAEERVAIVRMREAFDRDAGAFIAQYESAQLRISQQIEQAIAQIDHLVSAENMRLEIANRCIAAGVDGLRADIVWHRAAVAHAAWKGKSAIDIGDIDAVEELVIGHRRSNNHAHKSGPPPGSSPEKSNKPQQAQTQTGDWGHMEPVKQVTAPRSLYKSPAMKSDSSMPAQSLFDIYAKSRGESSRGASKGRKSGTQLDWFQTFASNLGAWPLRWLRHRKVTTGRPRLHLILLDTSASTLKNNRFADARAAIINIAEQAYLAREQLTILGFGNQRVQTLLPRKRAPRALRKLLDTIDAGGGTPLLEVIERARHYQQNLRRAQPSLRVRNYLITDGKSTVALQDLTSIGETILIDIEESRVKRGRGVEIAGALDALYLPLPA
jgi:magnesium chelatase subunit D